ncbi:unnamed protein product [Effrenium voratum]|nr:unnamed protein product [Effrenium voratum]
MAALELPPGRAPTRSVSQQPRQPRQPQQPRQPSTGRWQRPASLALGIALWRRARCIARGGRGEVADVLADAAELQEAPAAPGFGRVRYAYPWSSVQAHAFEPAKQHHFIDGLRAGYFFMLHVIAFACGPSTFSYPALACCVFLFVLLQTLGISLSYHRHLTHRSFECHKYFEYFIAWCGVLNMQGNPVWWAMNHAWHHQHSDTPRDPHTPREGLWTAHAGWFFEKERILSKMPEAIVAAHNSSSSQDSQSSDWRLIPWFYKESPDFYDWLRQSYYLHQIFQVVFLYALGGWGFVVWGFVVRLLLGIHCVSAVNSFAHVWGEQPWRTGDDSKNNFLVAMVSSGEGWHNNHHAFPRSARHGLLEGQFDLTYALIQLLEKLGVVWRVQLPSDAQLRAKSR